MSDLWGDPDWILDELRDNGIPRRQPRPGDPIWLYAERCTVINYDGDRVYATDEAGFAISRARASLWWDGEAWRAFGGEPR